MPRTGQSDWLVCHTGQSDRLTKSHAGVRILSEANYCEYRISSIFMLLVCFYYWRSSYKHALFSRSAERSELLIESGRRKAPIFSPMSRRTRVQRMTMARARNVVFLHLLCFSQLQWLTWDFKYEVFRNQWIPRNSECEVSMRDLKQGQRRLQARKELPRTDSIHI